MTIPGEIPVSDKPAEESSAKAASDNDDDLSAFLLNRLSKHQQELEVDNLLRALVKLEGSDLHMRVGSPPMIRIKGELRALNRGPVEAEEMVRLVGADDGRA